MSRHIVILYDKANKIAMNNIHEKRIKNTDISIKLEKLGLLILPEMVY